MSEHPAAIGLIEREVRRLLGGGQLDLVGDRAAADLVVRHRDGLGDGILPPLELFLADRHARQLDDAALDGVHQREVAHRPGEERPLGIAGAAEEEGRGGEIQDSLQAELAIDRFETGDPDACGFAVLFGLLLLVSLQTFLFI